MTHYEKIATVVIRVISLIGIIYGLIQALLTAAFSPDFIAPSRFWFTFAPYLITGVTFFALSKTISELVCLGLGKDDEK